MVITIFIYFNQCKVMPKEKNAEPYMAASQTFVEQPPKASAQARELPKKKNGEKNKMFNTSRNISTFRQLTSFVELPPKA